jgi:hypothetical protein
MTEIEYLLICLSEELAEVQQEIGKCLRFTPNHKPDVYPTTNLERLRLERMDVAAVARLLLDRGVDTQLTANLARVTDDEFDRYNAKKDRTLNLMALSKEMGVVDAGDN